MSFNTVRKPQMKNSRVSTIKAEVYFFGVLVSMRKKSIAFYWLVKLRRFFE